MRSFRQILKFVTWASVALFLNACISTNEPPSQAATGASTSVGDFPYNPLVYHLDLSILAYQLHAQSLIWPFDPFYEEVDRGAKKRDAAIAKVRRWAASPAARRTGLKSFRGPGVLNGFADNPTHDPIVYDYSLIHPWSNALTNASGTFTEYLTPKSITGRIRETRVCYRPSNASEGKVAMGRVAASGGGRNTDARDTLWAFEGGTGDKGEAGQPASQSLMGFILLRSKSGGGYDAHIAFRGSRSGKAGRAVKEGLSDRRATGNPDWITDLGYDRLTAEAGGALISTKGLVHRGFAESMRSILPNLMHCLGKAAGQKGGVRPTSIYVTGHSLGGALAQSFASAMLLGDGYGPMGKGSAMPSTLKNWPWSTLKLITFSAPRVGDAEFADALTVGALQSTKFSTVVNPIDVKALAPNDSSIVPRLLDSNLPVGFRVLHSKDPVTTQKVIGGKHVGQTIYVNRASVAQIFTPPKFSVHDQNNVRGGMLDSLQDERIPNAAMKYHDMAEFNPTYVKSQRGSRAELEKIVAAISAYYARTGTWFDRAAFERNVALRFAIAAPE